MDIIAHGLLALFSDGFTALARTERRAERIARTKEPSPNHGLILVVFLVASLGSSCAKLVRMKQPDVRPTSPVVGRRD